MGCGGSKQAEVKEQDSPKKDRQQQQQQRKRSTAHSTPVKASPAKLPAKTTDTKTDTPRDKYLVNGSTNGTSTRSDSVFSEATDKGFKRRLREKLKEATAGTDMDELDKAMDKFTRNKLEDCGDYTRAMDRMELLKLRRDLRDAIRRSHVGILEKTIQEAENSQYSGQLQNQIEAARLKLQHLKELNEYKHDILNMEQSTISEIHSYQRPPLCVHDVMVATYLLLGYPVPRLTEWSDIQMMLCRVGRDSLIHEIRDFDSANVNKDSTNRVQDILSRHELHDIRQASNGAAAFYVWTTQICGKVERDQAKEEERQREDEAEEKRRKSKTEHQDMNGTPPTRKDSPPRKKQKG